MKLLLKWLDFIVVFIFVCFLFSGLIKWAGIFPIDATILFGSFTIISLIVAIFTKRSKNFTYQFYLVSLMIMIFLWILVSCTYTVSTHYYQYKLLQTFLLMVCFLYGVYGLEGEKSIVFFKSSLNILGVITIGLLIFVYYLGGFSMDLYLKLSDAHIFRERALPDYLSIGDLLVIIFLINLTNNKLGGIIIKFLAFMFLVLLAGRGPLIGLGLSLFLGYVVRFKLNFKTLLATLALVISLPIAFTLIKNWEGAEYVTQRFESASKNKDSSVDERYYFIKNALNMIEDAPIIGTGYGSFGIYTFGQDMRAYPHNLFLELFSETGLIGFLLILVFFILFLANIFRKVLFSVENQFLGLILSTFYLLIQSLKSSSFCDMRNFFAFIGVSISLYYFTIRKSTKKEASFI